VFYRGGPGDMSLLVLHSVVCNTAQIVHYIHILYLQNSHIVKVS
jgi:hypothetical protein